MKITAIESRVIGYDIAERAGSMPEAIDSTGTSTRSTRSTPTRASTATRCSAAGGRRRDRATSSTRRTAAAPRRGPDRERAPLAGPAPPEPPRVQPDRRSSATIDIALWDIRGKAAGLPIAALLGLARDHDPAPTPPPAPSTRRPSRSTRRRSSRGPQGYRGFKIQFWDGLERDIPRFRAAREAVGPDFPLFQDAAGLLLLDRGAGRGPRARRAELHAGSRSRSRTARCSSSSASPTRSDSRSWPRDARGSTSCPRALRHRRRATSSAATSSSRAASPGCARRRGGRAASAIDLEIHGLGAPLLDAANLHVALSIENCRFVRGAPPDLRAAASRAARWPSTPTARHLPDAPGLGVEMDWDWVDDHTRSIRRTPAA